MSPGEQSQDARTDALWLPAHWHQLDLSDAVVDESIQNDDSRAKELKCVEERTTGTT